MGKGGLPTRSQPVERPIADRAVFHTAVRTPAIIFATQVNGKVAAGDVAGAQDASKKAKMFSFIAIGLGVAGILIYVIMLVLGVGLSAIGNR